MSTKVLVVTILLTIFITGSSSISNLTVQPKRILAEQGRQQEVKVQFESQAPSASCKLYCDGKNVSDIEPYHRPNDIVTCSMLMTPKNVTQNCSITATAIFDIMYPESINFTVEKELKDNLDTLMEREQNLAAPVVNSNTNDMAFSDTDFPKDCNNRSNLHTGKEKADTLKEREQYLATPVVNSNTDDKTFSDTDIPKDGNYGSNLHTKEEQADTLTEREQYLATPVVNSHTDDKAFSDADISKDGNHGSDSHSWEEQADTLTEREQYLATPVVNRNTNEIF